MGNNVSCFLDAGHFKKALEAKLYHVIANDLCKNTSLARHSLKFSGEKCWHLAATAGDVSVLEIMVNAVKTGYQAQQKQHSSLPDLESKVTKLLNQTNDTHQTPLMLACETGNVPVIKFLLQNGADPYSQDRAGHRTCIHYAAVAGKASAIEVVLRWVEEHPGRYTPHPGQSEKLVEASTMIGATPLHYAAWANKKSAVATLLRMGASPTACTRYPSYGEFECEVQSTPLHVAAVRGAEKAVRALLRGYVDVVSSAPLLPGQFAPPDPRLMRDSTGNTPFQAALDAERYELLDLLHPMAQLRALFGEEAREAGVPTLQDMVAPLAQMILLKQLDDFEASLQPAAPPLNTLSSTPSRKSRGQVPVLLQALQPQRSSALMVSQQQQSPLEPILDEGSSRGGSTSVSNNGEAHSRIRSMDLGSRQVTVELANGMAAPEQAADPEGSVQLGQAWIQSPTRSPYPDPDPRRRGEQEEGSIQPAASLSMRDLTSHVQLQPLDGMLLQPTPLLLPASGGGQQQGLLSPATSAMISPFARACTAETLEPDQDEPGATASATASATACIAAADSTASSPQAGVRRLMGQGGGAALGAPPSPERQGSTAAGAGGIIRQGSEAAAAAAAAFRSIQKRSLTLRSPPPLQLLGGLGAATAQPAAAVAAVAAGLGPAFSRRTSLASGEALPLVAATASQPRDPGSVSGSSSSGNGSSVCLPTELVPDPAAAASSDATAAGAEGQVQEGAATAANGAVLDDLAKAQADVIAAVTMCRIHRLTSGVFHAPPAALDSGAPPLLPSRSMSGCGAAGHGSLAESASTSALPSPGGGAAGPPWDTVGASAHGWLASRVSQSSVYERSGGLSGEQVVLGMQPGSPLSPRSGSDELLPSISLQPAAWQQQAQLQQPQPVSATASPSCGASDTAVPGPVLPLRMPSPPPTWESLDTDRPVASGTYTSRPSSYIVPQGLTRGASMTLAHVTDQGLTRAVSLKVLSPGSVALTSADPWILGQGPEPGMDQLLAAGSGSLVMPADTSASARVSTSDMSGLPMQPNQPVLGPAAFTTLSAGPYSASASAALPPGPPAQLSRFSPGSRTQPPMQVSAVQLQRKSPAASQRQGTPSPAYQLQTLPSPSAAGTLTPPGPGGVGSSAYWGPSSGLLLPGSTGPGAVGTGPLPPMSSSVLHQESVMTAVRSLHQIAGVLMAASQTDATALDAGSGNRDESQGLGLGQGPSAGVVRGLSAGAVGSGVLGGSGAAEPGMVGGVSPRASMSLRAPLLQSPGSATFGRRSTSARPTSSSLNLLGLGVASASASAMPSGPLQAQISSLLEEQASVMSAEEWERTCGVCLDEGSFVGLRKCGHRLCVLCARELVKLHRDKPALCPFCRGPIQGFITTLAQPCGH